MRDTIDARPSTMVDNLRDPRGVHIKVTRGGEIALFELTTSGPTAVFRPAVEDVFHLHENNKGEPDPTPMQRTLLFQGKVAFSCSCNLRILMHAWDLDFGHIILFTAPQLEKHFSVYSE